MSIERNVHPDVYHRRVLGELSKSGCDKVAQCPASYREWCEPTGPQPEPTKAMLFGSAFHMAALEPARFEATYAVMPNFGDGRTAAAKAAKADWFAANGGKTEISDADHAQIHRMIAGILAHPAASRLMLDGIPEVSLRWQDSETGLQCKGRADLYVPSRKLCVDLKTTEDASPEAFCKSVANYGYHRQDAIYRAGFAACGEPIDHFAIIAVEKSRPHNVAVYTLDAHAIELGYASFRSCAAIVAECMRTGVWPGYGDDVRELSLPKWAA
jgi:PDDEXK-like domain of unknown function (DUF3799)